MDNQHKMIKGYRDLSAEEIDLMNAIKAMAEQVGELVLKVSHQLALQWEAADGEDLDSEARCAVDSAIKWAQLGKNDLQTGFMKLTRAVAQPTTF